MIAQGSPPPLPGGGRDAIVRTLHDQFNQAPPGVLSKIMLIAAGILTTFLVLAIIGEVQRRMRRRTPRSRWRLFREVLRGLGLPRTDRWLMWTMARSARVHEPAALLISSGQFDDAADYLASRSWLSSGSLYDRLLLIRTRLFPDEPDREVSAY